MHCSYITCTVITWNSKNLLCSLHKNFCGYYQKQHFTIFASHAGAVAKYCDEYVCLWACLSVCRRGYLGNHMRNLYQIFCACCLCPWLGPPLTCLRLSASCIAGKGFSSPMKMHYQPGKGDGSAQHGRSIISTTALFCLFYLQICVLRM